MEDDGRVCFWFISLLVICVVRLSLCVTDPNDFEVLSDFRKGLENPELLKWPEKGDDPCGPPSWPHVFCSGNRITQIQVQSLGLKGRLPQNFNSLSKLYNVGLQNNGFYGNLPTLNGLSELEYAYLNDNQFDTIPDDFFVGLTNLRIIALDHNPLNASTGWSIPNELQNSGQLMEISFVECNLVGQVPDFLGTLPSLQLLELSFNNLSGVIPGSFSQSLLQKLWLNNQNGGGMSGSIDVVTTMSSMTQLWLHGNQFSGTIPESIGNLTTLRNLNLNGNRLVGLIPESLANMQLDELDLNNNLFMGPMPKFKSRNVTCAANPFCRTKPGLDCAPEVAALIDFLGALDYPANLASDWSGNDPCSGPWLGLSCNALSKVSIINLPSRRLNGTFSPSVSKLNSLVEIRLGKNNLTGVVPGNISDLRSLRLMDLSENNFQPPLPRLPDTVRLITDRNPLLVTNQSSSPSPASSQEPSNKTSPGAPASAFPRSPPSPLADSPAGSTLPKQIQSITKKSKPFKAVIIIVGIAAFTLFVLLAIVLFVYYRKKRICTSEAPPSVVIHPRDSSDPRKKVKVAVSSSTTGSLSTRTGASSWSGNSSLVENSHMIDVRNHVISVQVLRKMTKNFATENELGRGGFGVVYKGELEDGTNIAVKRMEAGVITSKGLEEFEAEIAVLSKVRHRHLVSLLGYSIEGSERLLVYEYLPQGALSKHLFHWKSLNLEPLSWTRRLTIALDVARGVEYLHCLARQSFIHRDLKSSNILLGDDYRAKVSDFGLVKLAPDREKSVATRLAGTFGYLAPEYAVMGKITTKADVFSFGVVLMELLTGMTALDETRSEEKRYLAEWFCRIKSSEETLTAALDPVINANEVTFESISTVVDLAGHCTARDPLYRPDMGHAVNVLGSLVEKWQPLRGESEYASGIDFSLALPQMLKVWKEAENEKYTSGSFSESKTSIPPRPAGFGESFTSADAR